VLIIDGSYLQIGIRELNANYDTNFRLERETSLKKFFQFLEILVGHPHNKIVFVSAEDYDGMTRHESFYLKM
jgi:hypothetical protein